MRRWGARAALLMGSLGMALGGAELAARSLWEVPSWHGGSLDAANSEAECTAPSPTRGWTAVPGTCGRDEDGALTELANDFLDEDAPTALLLGDSVTYNGGWVNEAIRSSGTRIWNHGMSGYDPCQEADLMRELPQLADADHLILQLTDNDLDGSPAAVPYEDGLRLHVGPTSAVDIPSWAMHSRLALFALTNWGLRRDRRAPALDKAACIQTVARTAEARGIPATIVHWPLLDAEPSRNEELLREIAAGSVAHVIDVRELLERSLPDPSTWRMRPNDKIHPSMETGNVVGEALGERLANP
ncbi:MAG: hypothetical protein GY884_20170 [Proteobacteria bacterium]|nr:hypothetical protein [Pseudomonadota bacterium]